MTSQIGRRWLSRKAKVWKWRKKLQVQRLWILWTMWYICSVLQYCRLHWRMHRKNCKEIEMQLHFLWMLQTSIRSEVLNTPEIDNFLTFNNNDFFLHLISKVLVLLSLMVLVLTRNGNSMTKGLSKGWDSPKIICWICWASDQSLCHVRMFFSVDSLELAVPLSFLQWSARLLGSWWVFSRTCWL